MQHARSISSASKTRSTSSGDSRMLLAAIDHFEPALAEVLLRGGGQQVELADAARGQAVEQLAHDFASDAEAAVVGPHGDRAQQCGEFVRLGAAAGDDGVAVARD